MNDMFNSAISSIGAGYSTSDFDKLLKKRYKGQPVPMVTIRKGVGLIYEGSGWRISAGWPQEEKIGMLLSQAAMYEQSGDLKEAKARYEEALNLNGSLIEIKEKIESIKFQMKPAWEAQRDLNIYVEKMLEEKRRQGY